MNLLQRCPLRHRTMACWEAFAAHQHHLQASPQPRSLSADHATWSECTIARQCTALSPPHGVQHPQKFHQLLVELADYTPTLGNTPDFRLLHVGLRSFVLQPFPAAAGSRQQPEAVNVGLAGYDAEAPRYHLGSYVPYCSPCSADWHEALVPGCSLASPKSPIFGVKLLSRRMLCGLMSKCSICISHPRCK